MTIKEQILRLFKLNNDLTIKEIVDKTGASKQMVHIAMKQLTDAKKVQKFGSVPKTIYRLIKEDNSKFIVAPETKISEEQKVFLNTNFLAVTNSGNLVKGISAFEYWCEQRKLPIEKTISEFISTKKKYEKYYNKNGLINGMEKLKSTKEYKKIWLDDLFYLDFYAIERFGKTPLGTLLHYAKQGQNKFLMRKMMDEISERITSFIKTKNADALGFVPPTIKREVQIMKFIQQNLKHQLPVIEIKKISGIIPVPQKSLSKLNERIINAENSFAVTEKKNFKHIVLIDDAVGSGSTLNQIAEKIKNKKVATKITGLAVVGSFKGFDVITDV